MATELLGNLFRVRSGDGISIANLSSFGTYPVYGGNGVNGYTSDYNVESETMVVGRVGEKCGNVNITRSRSWVSDNALIVTPKIEYDIGYMSYLLEQVNLNDYANRNAQPVISGQIIYAIETPYVEDIEEQGIIAQNLRSFDAYIDDLAELIEKKKGIRDGALEDLMSGKTRIGGFKTEWAEYPFEVYFSTLPNNTFSRDKLSEHGEIGDIHYGDVLIKYGDVLTDDYSIPRIKDISQVKENWYLRKHDVIIADTAEDEAVGKVVQIGTVSIPLVGGLHTVVCRPNYDTAEGFLGYYMNSKLYHDQLYPYITGIKVSSISKKSFGETMLNIPADVNEQAAIVSVLSAMDNEIRDLETEREKIIQIREGAMDDLLTGRVRLTK